MRDQKQALIDLRDKVKAEEDPCLDAWVYVFYRSAFYAIESFNGSLDAAKALHEAVLPGWGWAIEEQEAAVWHPDTGGVSRDLSRAHNPARAWLLAILETLIAQEADA